MDPGALAARIEAIEGRAAGSDAERRAAAVCSAALRETGRRPRTATVWFRPRQDWSRAVQATAGVVGSIVAANHALAGLAVAGGALLVAVAEAAGVPVLLLPVTRRATQNVVAAPPAGDGRVLLVLAASVDTPREGVLSGWEQRLRQRPAAPSRSALLALLPGPVGAHVVALTAVAALAGARVAGAGGTALGAVQLLPTIVLIALVGAFIDAAAARVAQVAPGGGPGAALAVAAALDARPPRHARVEVLVAGAGDAGAAGMRAYVRARRKTLRAEDVVVVHLGSGGGPPRTVLRDGEILGVRLHPRLAELAVAAAAPVEGRRTTNAVVARAAGWPAIALEGEPRALAAAALRLVAAVDRELAAG